MNWVEPYRKAIMKLLPQLENNSFSFIGEDAFSLKFTDGDILLIYVDFLLANNARLFGKVFPLAKQYHEFSQSAGARALDRFAKANE